MKTTDRQKALERVNECANRLIDYADFKLGGTLSSTSHYSEIPSNAASSVKSRHLASLRDAVNEVKRHES